MQRSMAFVSVVAVLAFGPGAVAQTMPRITQEWAASASPEEAGERLLGPLSEIYPNYSGAISGGFSSGRLDGVAFAGVPRGSGMADICEVDVIGLTFAPDLTVLWEPTADQRYEREPVVVREVDERRLYRAVGDGSGQPMSGAEAAALDAGCALERDGWAFGHANSAVDVWIAVRMQTLVPEFAEERRSRGEPWYPPCAATGDCRIDPLLLDVLRNASFDSVEIRPCDGRFVERQTYPLRGPFCMRATYVIAQHANEFDLIVLRATFEQAYSSDGGRMLDPVPSDFSFERVTIVED
jgi:hypothetical protein